MSCTSLLTRKAQVLGRVQTTHKTAETLAAQDGKILVYTGATPDYQAERTKRDVVLPTLTNIGTVESTKPLALDFRCEVTTPDAFLRSGLDALDVESIVWQSANIVRITFAGTPTLTSVVVGDYITIYYDAEPNNNGTFKIDAVNSGSYYVDVVNRKRTSATGDTASASTGVGTIQNTLPMNWALVSSNLDVHGLARIAVGTITGTYTFGETITGGTSNATGKVMIPSTGTAGYIWFLPLTGKFQSSETITGGTSGATCTSSAAPIVHGFGVLPWSGCNEVATVEYQEDGNYWQARDAMADLSMECPANSPAFFDFSYMGSRAAIGEKAFTTGITRGTEDPPVSKNSELKLDSFLPVWSQWSFELANNVSMRPNGNATDDTGLEGARVSAREPVVKITLEHVKASTFDFFTKLDAGTKVYFQAHIGSTISKQVWFFAPYLEFNTLPLGDAEGIRTLEVEAACTGTADDEFAFVFIGD